MRITHIKKQKNNLRLNEFKEMKRMPTIVHFDISADNIERAKKFYNKLFDWKIEKSLGPTEYYLIETRTSKGEIGITGGIAKREKDYQKITNFIEVPSIDESITNVKLLGGKIIEPKTAIPTVGYIAGCLDTENNIFGIIEITQTPNDPYRLKKFLNLTKSGFEAKI